MLTDKIIKKVPGEIPKDKKEYLDNLDKLSIESLTEVLHRQEKLLSDSYISNKVASSVELLNHLNVDDLKMILNENNKFDDVLKDALDCKDIANDKEVLIASNKSLAEFNLTKETNMFDLKREIIELSQTGEQLYLSVEEKLGRVNNRSGAGNLEEVLALLQTSACTADEESESLANEFLNGRDTNVDSFIEQFIKKKKLSHLRRVKAEIMKDLVRKRIARSDTNSTNMDRVLPPGNSRVPYYPSVNPVPYPLAPIAMPLPSINNYNHFH